MTRIALTGILLSAAFTLTLGNAQALEGVEKCSLVINGHELSVVVGNKDRRDDIYYLKKALAGDIFAREIFLQGKKERWFFIGDDAPLWLVVTEKEEKVVEP